MLEGKIIVIVVFTTISMGKMLVLRNIFMRTNATSRSRKLSTSVSGSAFEVILAVLKCITVGSLQV